MVSARANERTVFGHSRLALRSRACLGLPKASASRRGHSAGWAATAGHTRHVFDRGVPLNDHGIGEDRRSEEGDEDAGDRVAGGRALGSGAGAVVEGAHALDVGAAQRSLARRVKENHRFAVLDVTSRLGALRPLYTPHPPSSVGSTLGCQGMYKAFLSTKKTRSETPIWRLSTRNTRLFIACTPAVELKYPFSVPQGPASLLCLLKTTNLRLIYRCAEREPRNSRSNSAAWTEAN